MKNKSPLLYINPVTLSRQPLLHKWLARSAVKMADTYKYPGEYKHHGATYSSSIIKDTLEKIASEPFLTGRDVVIATYPKSGTTWMEQILYSVDVGPEKAKGRTECMNDLIQFPELFAEGEETQYDKFKADASPRLMKTHLNVSYYKRFLEGQIEQCPKFIIVARNPKDTLVSYYHFHKMIHFLEFADRSWDDFFQMYKEKRLSYGDPVDYYVGWWKYRDHPNLLFVHYEEMLKDSVAAVHRVADVLGRTLTEDEVKLVVQQSSFKQMREKGLGSYIRDPHFYQEDVSPFFRSGKKGDWRSYFSSEQSDYIDSYVKVHAEPVGLSYSF